MQLALYILDFLPIACSNYPFLGIFQLPLQVIDLFFDRAKNSPTLGLHCSGHQGKLFTSRVHPRLQMMVCMRCLPCIGQHGLVLRRSCPSRLIHEWVLRPRRLVDQCQRNTGKQRLVVGFFSQNVLHLGRWEHLHESSRTSCPIQSDSDVFRPFSLIIPCEGAP